jgi:hypothetical protein
MVWRIIQDCQIDVIVSKTTNVLHDVLEPVRILITEFRFSINPKHCAQKNFGILKISEIFGILKSDDP